MQAFYILIIKKGKKKMQFRKYILMIIFIITFISQIVGQSTLKFANFGDFLLENGAVIHDCKVGYRTFGKLDTQKSNAILFPTWFNGTTEHLAKLIGPAKLVDSSKYFVIAVDAFGNGISSSPSNSIRQHGRTFPKFSIRDMVNAQHKLLTDILDIFHLRGIIGGSMGGMQTFEWVVSYPEFMDKAISYVGSPRLTSYDLLLCQTELLAIEVGQNCHCQEEAIMKIVATINKLAAQTPYYRVKQTSREEFTKYLTTYYQDFANNFNADNWASQLRAMMAHDVSAPFGESLAKAATVVQAQVFIIVATQDHLVNPAPALEFARLINAETLELNSDCGHLAVSCEMEKVVKAVRSFFDR